MFDTFDLDYTPHACLNVPETPVPDVEPSLTSILPGGVLLTEYIDLTLLDALVLSPTVRTPVIPTIPPLVLTPAELYGTPEDDVIQGSMNGETIYGYGGNDSLYGSDGDDLIEAGDGNDVLGGDRGDDTLYGDDGNDSINGHDGNDFLGGGNGNDTIYGGDGNDIIEAGDGDDFVRAGRGTDALYGLGGDDFLNGGEGNDQLFGELGDDSLFGGEGEDCLYGGQGNDQLAGAQGDDHLHGEAGDDGFQGGEGNDLIFGGAGNDYWISGDEGDDTLYGEAGNDVLLGGAGDDLLYGGAGNDYIQGSEGNSIAEFDTLLGGPQPNDGIESGGRDTFVLGNELGSFYYETGIFNDPSILQMFPDGYATIEDFNQAEGDTIQLHGDASLYQIIHGSFSGSSNINDAMIVRLTPTRTAFSVERIGLVVDAPNLSLSTDFTFV